MMLLKIFLFLCVGIAAASDMMAGFHYTDECFLSPCSYGTCIDEDQDYSCVCQPGFTGRRCCTDIDECQDNLCVNGTCVDAINGYSCVCEPGYEGAYCDQDVDDCVNNTCFENATCEDEFNDFLCVCPNDADSCDWRTYDLTQGYLNVEASSSAWNGRPEYALNGIKTGYHNVDPCHHSGGESEPWWKVTLAQPYNIRRLVITNRLEGWSHRFRDITIYVDDQVCARYPGPAPQNKLTLEITCERDDLIGQTIKITKDGATLTICEVEVYKY